MKTLIYSIFLLLFFYSTQNIYSQNAPTSLGMAPRLVEQSINKVPYNPVYFPRLPDSTAFGDDAYSFNFVRVPLPGGTPLAIIDTLYGLAYGGAFVDTVFYALRNDSLITIDLTTAVVTNIAPLSGVENIATSLAYRQPNGPMYLGTTNITTSKLYRVNIQTGIAAFIGDITNCPGLLNFSINCEGKLYGVDIANDNLISIDTATGAGTIVGPLGVNLNYAQGSAFELSSGTLYLAAYSTEGQLRTVNLTTGASTLITSWPGSEIVAFGIPGNCNPPIESCEIQVGPFLNLPVEMIPMTFYPIKAKIANMGTATLTNVPVTLLVNGTQYGATQYIATLGPKSIDTATVFSWAPSASGSAVLQIFTSMDCDTNHTNDTVSETVSVGCAAVFTDDFEHGLNSWTITNNGGDCVWGIKTQFANHFLCADADACGPNSHMNTTATLTSALNFTNKKDVYLEFDSDFYVFENDTGYIDASFDGGSNWVNLVTWTESRRLSHEVILLPPATNNPAVKIRFTSVQPGWDWWWALDNITVHACDMVGVPKNGTNAPSIYALSQNYPNPFNPTTTISYQIPKAGNIKLVVYDVLGREVKVMVNEFKKAGTYHITFDGTSLASGLYLYRLTAGDFTQSKKMILIK